MKMAFLVERDTILAGCCTIWIFAFVSQLKYAVKVENYCPSLREKRFIHRQSVPEFIIFFVAYIV